MTPRKALENTRSLQSDAESAAAVLRRSTAAFS